MKFKALCLPLVLACVASSEATLMWDEGLHGDLSGDRFLPTNLTVTPGSNELIGTTGPGDRDYFHFSLAPGQALTGIIVRDYVSEDPLAFLAVQEGLIITEDPTNANVANLLGWTLWGTAEVGTDILPAMGLNWGSIGFVPPLTGPDYSFWLQQTGDPASYVLDFQVVPEPSTLVLSGGLIGLFFRRRRARVGR